MDLSGKNVVVVGLGASGIAAAKLCVQHGATVTGTDTRSSLTESVPGVALCLGGHDGVDFEHADVVVVSPGVPPLEILDRAAARGAEVISEVELASRFLKAPIAAVGGTNGKSTTTVLLGTILEAYFSKVFVGGNLGRPLAEAPLELWDAVVVEVSSFQMERLHHFRPRVAALLNITADHLDRYRDMQSYADAKGNAFLRQQPEDIAVVPIGDDLCLAQARRGRGRLVTFGPGGDYELDDTGVLERASREHYELVSSALVGRHNWLNAAAAIAAARGLSVPADSIRQGLARFSPLPHRLTRVAEHTGVTYYDDSKATNVDAAATALLGLAEPRVVLIAGGRDKGGAYEALVAAVMQKRGSVVLIGEAATLIEQACEGRVPVAHAGSMVEAVATAARLAQAGDAVLLSPACSSFDMFKNYADRGDQFAEAVRQMTKGAGT